MSETVDRYTKEAILRAKTSAVEWLAESEDGYPRSWAEETRRDTRRGYELYDDLEAPPIAGYEALEREGLAVRVGVVNADGEERVHFRKDWISLPRGGGPWEVGQVLT